MERYLEWDDDLNKTSLKRLPWIGINYPTSKQKILILGDSHYAEADSEEDVEKIYNWFFEDKESTIKVVEDNSNHNFKFKFFEGLYKLFELETTPKRKDFWEKIAFYNFVQEVMKEKDECPKTSHYNEAGKCLLEVIEIIKPNFILFIGLRGINKNQISGFFWECDKPIQKSKPVYGEIRLSNLCIPFKAIRHTSRGFLYKDWREYLYSKKPDIMQFLIPKEK